MVGMVYNRTVSMNVILPVTDPNAYEKPTLRSSIDEGMKNENQL